MTFENLFLGVLAKEGWACRVLESSLKYIPFSVSQPWCYKIEMCFEINLLSWCLISQNVWGFLFFDFQPLKSSASLWISSRFSLWHLCENDDTNTSITLFIYSCQGSGSCIPLFLLVWPKVKTTFRHLGNFSFVTFPFVLLLWQVAFCHRNSRRGGGRRAELHKVMNTCGEETHFACVSEEMGDMPQGSRFRMKVAELSIWCSEVSTLPNGYSGKFTLELFKQMLTTTNREGFFFFLTMWGKAKWIWIFTKSSFSEDAHHFSFSTWVDLLRRYRALWTIVSLTSLLDAVAASLQ